MTLRDAEVIELLQDKPELLAIADAVSATQQGSAQPRRRRRIVVRSALVLAAAAAVLTGVLAAPQGQPAIIGRALAAIGTGRILHLVTETPSGIVYVDLKTGRRTAPFIRDELWVDQRGNRFHLVVSENGRVLGDLLWPADAKSGATAGALGPAFAALWTGYRAALASGAAAVAGRGTIEGHSVYWLRFEPTTQDQRLPRKERPTTEVAVDAHTYKPIVFRTSVNGRHLDQRVLLARTIPFRPAEFKRRGPSLFAGSSSSGGTSTGPVNPNQPPSTLVRAPWLTAGTTVAGLKLRAATPLTATSNNAGKHTSIKGIELVYGAYQFGGASALSTTIDELPRPDDPHAWSQIPAHAIQIETSEETTSSQSVAHPKLRNSTHAIWTGKLKAEGLYVTITTAKGEHALLTIARSLHRPGT